MKQIMLTLLLVVACVSFAIADDLGGFTILKISGADARAVVRNPAGEKQLVAPGDVLGDATITEIAADRVVLEQAGPDAAAVLIVRVVNGRQQVSKVQQMPVKENAVSIESEVSSKQSVH